MRNRPCPVTSRIRPRASIQAMFRWTAARPAPAIASAIGAGTRDRSASTARRAGGVLPKSVAIRVSARFDHAAISSRCRIAVRHAVFIPSSHRPRRSAGGPTARSPPAPPIASGEKTAPLHSLASIRAAVTAASIQSPCCPKARKAPQVKAQAGTGDWVQIGGFCLQVQPTARTIHEGCGLSVQDPGVAAVKEGRQVHLRPRPACQMAHRPTDTP